MVQVEAERFPLGANLMEEMDDVGDTAREDARDAGVWDFDDCKVVDRAGDDERDED